MEQTYTLAEVREAFMTFDANLPDPTDEDAPQEFSHRQIWMLFEKRLHQIKAEQKIPTS